MTVPLPTRIYHITHGKNLASIVQTGGLRSHNELLRWSGEYCNIAYHSIQERRSKKIVPCGAGGTLHDYVPFYFAPRSPMLFAIHKNAVGTYTGGQRPLLHLVATAQAIEAARIPFAFTDGHAIIRLTSFYDDLNHLDQVDWQIMRERFWSDVPVDNDRSRRRQAEFLVRDFVPWEFIAEIGVCDSKIARRVGAILAGASHRPAVRVHRGWYY